MRSVVNSPAVPSTPVAGPSNLPTSQILEAQVDSGSTQAWESEANSRPSSPSGSNETVKNSPS